MELRWTQEAAADLERITDYLFEHTPGHAERLVRALHDAPATLLTFPNRGRPGKKEGTRELVLAPLPWILVYAVRDEVVLACVSVQDHTIFARIFASEIAQNRPVSATRVPQMATWVESCTHSANMVDRCPRGRPRRCSPSDTVVSRWKQGRPLLSSLGSWFLLGLC
jgi:addiction module RelE/StbE family toxin